MLSDTSKADIDSEWRRRFWDAAKGGTICGIQSVLRDIKNVTDDVMDGCIGAIYLCIEKENVEMVCKLLSSTIFEGKQCRERLLTELPDLLYHALSQSDNYLPIVEVIIDTLSLRDDGFNHFTCFRNMDGFSAVHLAAIDGDIASAQRIFDLGGDSKLQSKDGNTALTLAIAYDHPKFWEFILPLSEVNTHDHDGDTPLIFAAWRRQYELVDALLDRGADCNARSNFSTSALWNAVYKRANTCVKVLIENGADMRVKCEGTCLFLEEENDDNQGGEITLIYPGAPRSLLWLCVNHCGQSKTRHDGMEVMSLLFAAGYDTRQDNWVSDLKLLTKEKTSLLKTQETHPDLPSNILNDSELTGLLCSIHSQPLHLRDLCRNKLRSIFVDSKNYLSFNKWVSALDVGIYTEAFLTIKYL